MINVQNISSKLASLPDQALKQYAEMHKEDPYVFSLALSESNRRKELRSRTQQPDPQPKVVDKELADMDVRKALPEDLGIARIPVDMNMAGGGIVAFGDGGYVPTYKKDGLVDSKKVFVDQYGPVAVDVGKQLGVDPSILLAQWGLESKFGESTVGQFNVGNIKDFSNKGPKGFDKIEKSNSSYREYDSPEEFGKDYAELIKRNFPKAIGAGADVDTFASGLQNGRFGSYATGKDYGKTLSKVLTSIIPISSAQAETAPPAEKESSLRDILPKMGGDKVSDQSLSELITGKPKPAKMETPSATFSGVGKALMTPEGVKRAGIGALEDSVIGMAGMPSDVSRTMPTSPIPVLRGLGTAADYLKNKFAPNAPANVGTTEYLKEKATKAGIRPEDSTDPNLRAIQSGGEFAGYIAHPIDALRAGARKLGNVIGSGRAELAASGLQEIAEKKAAVAAAARAKADAAAQTANPIRIEAMPNTAPAAPTPRPTVPGVAPQLTPQPAGFPVSEEALLLKKQQQAAAAARANQTKSASTGPSLGAKAELDKIEAARKARIASALEQDAATAKAMADAKVAEAANVPSRVAGKGATSVMGKPALISSSGKVLARNTGKQDFPEISSSPETNVESDGSEYKKNENQDLLKRYPLTESGSESSTTAGNSINYDQGNARRDAGGDQSLSNKDQKAIVKATKDSVPNTEETQGWSSNDWLQFGLALMAGKSPNALTNVGEAGLSLLASKQAKELKDRELDLYKKVHLEKPGETEKSIQKLMESNPSLTYEEALSRHALLNTNPGERERGVKQIMDEKKIPYSQALREYIEGTEMPSRMAAIEQRYAAIAARSGTDAGRLAQTNLKDYYVAKKEIEKNYPSVLRTGSSATSKANKSAYEAEIKDLQEAFGISPGSTVTAPASGWGQATKH